jgi:hypothetical protein
MTTNPSANESPRPEQSDGDLQLGLFDAPILARATLESAIWEGDFVTADRARRELESEHGVDVSSLDVGFLPALVGARWSPPDADGILRGWLQAMDAIGEGHRRWNVSRGVLTRLLTSVTPAEIVASERRCIGDLLRLLQERMETDAVRTLVRDELLAGRDEGLSVREDRLVADVLGEDSCPERLACLGALRGAWSLPRPDGNELSSLLARQADAIPASDAARALAFWDCLRVLAMRAVLTEDQIIRTRLRMKQLDADLHRRHMERGG